MWSLFQLLRRSLQPFRLLLTPGLRKNRQFSRRLHSRHFP